MICTHITHGNVLWSVCVLGGARRVVLLQSECFSNYISLEEELGSDAELSSI